MKKPYVEKTLDNLFEIVRNGKKKGFTEEDNLKVLELSTAMTVCFSGNLIMKNATYKSRREIVRAVWEASMHLQNELMNYTGVSEEELREVVLSEIEAQEALEERFAGELLI